MVFAAERTNYPLAMAVDDSGVGFVLTALGQTGVDAGQVCRYLQTAVAGLLDLLEHAPQTPVQSLRVLPSAERRLVVEEWNRTEADFPQRDVGWTIRRAGPAHSRSSGHGGPRRARN